jgi:hypothetical protein
VEDADVLIRHELGQMVHHACRGKGTSRDQSIVKPQDSESGNFSVIEVDSLCHG